MSIFDILLKKENTDYWAVGFTNKSKKQVDKLPDKIFELLVLLVEDLKQLGPAPGKQWSNYGKFKGTGKKDKRHCHLSKGNPTYVCCWEVKDKNIKIIEVYYVGTHEKAPY